MEVKAKVRNKKECKNKAQRTERVSLRCTEEEKRALNELAERQKMNLSGYILYATDPNNIAYSKALIADRISLIHTMNEIFYLVKQSGNEVLTEQVKELLKQMGEEK